MMVNSSPNAVDLNGDGVADIVFGSGVDRLRPSHDGYVFTTEPEVPGRVIAVSGATNEVLWMAPNPGEAFTTPRFADLTGDGRLDVLIGGREGALSAYRGVDGALLWRTDPADIAVTPVPYNFFTPAVVGDLTGDGVPDLVVTYGGDDTRLPGADRDPGYLAVIAGADGLVVASHVSPDGNEVYSSPVVYRRPDGTEWVVFGTGGETHPGAAFRAPLTSLLDGTFADRAERLTEPGSKGVIAPATLVDVTGDGELDILVSTFDGRLIAIAGATGETIWTHEAPGEEAYHQPAVVRLDGEGRLGLFVSRGIGVFPRYVGSSHRLHDARDGTLLYEFKESNYPGGAPLATDLTGDGVDEPIFFSMRYPSDQGGRIHVLRVATQELLIHDLAGNLASTPLIADPRGTGTLELITVPWRIGAGDGESAPSWRNLEWELLRLDLGARTPATISWGGYMGTRADGHFAPRSGR
jgi:hypothetical protein